MDILNNYNNLSKYKDNNLLLSLLFNYILFFSYIYVSYIIISYYNKLYYIYIKIKKNNKKLLKKSNKNNNISDIIPDNWEDLDISSQDYDSKIIFFNKESNSKDLIFENIKEYILDASDKELNEILNICSKKILITNWYSKDCLENLTLRRISDIEWLNILNDYNNYSDINDIIYYWYK